MSTQTGPTREARLERRVAHLYARDQQFAAARPDSAVGAAADEPGLRLPDLDDDSRSLWKTRWEQFLRNRAVLQTDRVENTGVARSVKAATE